ncbi:dapA, partial [Symbiodinium sp. CCMP2456]
MGNLQTVGPLGVNLASGFLGSGFAGFDISGATGTAYLTSANPNQATSLYMVDLGTGAASLQGTVSGLIGQGVIADIAVAAVPEPTSAWLVVVRSNAPAPPLPAMITPDQLRGAHVALLTPMKPVGSLMGIDFHRVYKLIDTVLEAGVSGVLFAGTTGQSAMLSHDEQVDLCTRGIEYARAKAAQQGRSVTCLASAGSNSTDEALHLSERITKAIHPDALLHVTGYYNNPPQEGL